MDPGHFWPALRATITPTEVVLDEEGEVGQVVRDLGEVFTIMAKAELALTPAALAWWARQLRRAAAVLLLLAGWKG